MANRHHTRSYLRIAIQLASCLVCVVCYPMMAWPQSANDISATDVFNTSTSDRVIETEPAYVGNSVPHDMYGEDFSQSSCVDCADFDLSTWNPAGDGLFDNLSIFAGLDGSKQPQDFGVNANLGSRFHFNWAIPLSHDRGIGFQVGSAVEWSDNAVRVFEPLGEDTTRFQNFTTVGLFQRTESGFGWGIVYDHLYQNSYDEVDLGQWRGRISYEIDSTSEIGATVHLRAFGDTARFRTGTVNLRSIDQGSIYYRHTFETSVQLTGWMGVAGEHGESNAVTGPARPRDESFVFGADIHAPLNDSFAIFGETNLMMPADTGTVDAFLGIAWYPGGGAKRARRNRFSPILPVAADTSFSTDLIP